VVVKLEEASVVVDIRELYGSDQVWESRELAEIVVAIVVGPESNDEVDRFSPPRVMEELPQLLNVEDILQLLDEKTSDADV
jgi:hypothetical protein